MVVAFLKPSSGRSVKTIHSISKSIAYRPWRGVYKHYYFYRGGGVFFLIHTMSYEFYIFKRTAVTGLKSNRTIRFPTS